MRADRPAVAPEQPAQRRPADGPEAVGHSGAMPITRLLALLPCSRALACRSHGGLSGGRAIYSSRTPPGIGMFPTVSPPRAGDSRSGSTLRVRFRAPATVPDSGPLRDE